MTKMNAQSSEGNWSTYMATYEENIPGSTTLRMDLINDAPNKDFPFVLVTGVTFKTNRKDGFPEGDTFEKLYEIEDKRAQF